jgi:uncharacterized protein (TIGR02996 family)
VNDGDALLAAILKHPVEETPRLLYADWLDENGQPDRAEFIRVQVETARAIAEEPKDRSDAWLSGYRVAFHHEHRVMEAVLDVARPSRCVICLRDRSRKLLDGPAPVPGTVRFTNEANWFLGDVGDFGAFRPEYWRGFVECVTCTAHDWVRLGDTILARHPVERVLLISTPLLAADEDEVQFAGDPRRRVFAWEDVAAAWRPGDPGRHSAGGVLVPLLRLRYGDRIAFDLARSQFGLVEFTRAFLIPRPFDLDRLWPALGGVNNAPMLAFEPGRVQLTGLDVRSRGPDRDELVLTFGTVDPDAVGPASAVDFDTLLDGTGAVEIADGSTEALP